MQQNGGKSSHAVCRKVQLYRQYRQRYTKIQMIPYYWLRAAAEYYKYMNEIYVNQSVNDTAVDKSGYGKLNRCLVVEY